MTRVTFPYRCPNLITVRGAASRRLPGSSERLLSAFLLLGILFFLHPASASYQSAVSLDGFTSDVTGLSGVVLDAQGNVLISAPHYYQYDNPRLPGATCGPTSLAMCLNYFGKHYTPDQLIGPTGCGSDGTCLGGLVEAAVQCGFPNASSGDANSGYDLDWLNRNLLAGNPVIANIVTPRGSGHYMVVIGIDAQGNYICNDPAYPGPGNTLSPQELWNCWKNHHNCAAVVLK